MMPTTALAQHTMQLYIACCPYRGVGMLRIEDMDPRVTMRDQLGEETDQPVILVNQFSVAPPDVEAMLLAWAEDARFFKAQPGFISAQLHQGTAGSTTFLNHAVWQSVA